MATLNKNELVVILAAVSDALFGFTKSGIILNSANGTVKVIINSPIPAIIAAFESDIPLSIGVKEKPSTWGGLFDLNRFNYQFDAAVVSATFKAMIFKSKPLGNPILS